MDTYQKRLVFIDSCAVNCFARINLDPTKELHGTEFQVAFTPDLEAEYRQALAHPRVEPHIKQLLGALLERGVPREYFGLDGPPFSGLDEGRFISPSELQSLDSIVIRSRSNKQIPKNRTDSFLITLAQTEIVVTSETKSIWNRARDYTGLIFWNEIEAGIDQGSTLLSIFRSRIALMNANNTAEIKR
jgi:hypothetical protein